MSAKKWLALSEGTEVRMVSDCGIFNDTVIRVFDEEDDCESVRFDSKNDWHYLTDDQWELIEEPTLDTNQNLIKSDSPRMPKQGEKIQVRYSDWIDWYDWDFVCFYKDYVIAWDECGPDSYSEWRFPLYEEVTLSDGKTYLIVTRGDEKILKLKQQTYD